MAEVARENCRAAAANDDSQRVHDVVDAGGNFRERDAGAPRENDSKHGIAGTDGRRINVQQFYRSAERSRADVLFNGDRRVREISALADGRRAEPHEPHGIPRVFLLHDVPQHIHDRFGDDVSPEADDIRGGRGADNFHAVNADSAEVRIGKPAARRDSAGGISEQLRANGRADSSEYIRRREHSGHDDDDSRDNPDVQHSGGIRAGNVSRREICAAADNSWRAEKSDDTRSDSGRGAEIFGSGSAGAGFETDRADSGGDDTGSADNFGRVVQIRQYERAPAAVAWRDIRAADSGAERSFIGGDFPGISRNRFRDADSDIRDAVRGGVVRHGATNGRRRGFSGKLRGVHVGALVRYDFLLVTIFQDAGDFLNLARSCFTIFKQRSYLSPCRILLFKTLGIFEFRRARVLQFLSAPIRRFAGFCCSRRWAFFEFQRARALRFLSAPIRHLAEFCYSKRWAFFEFRRARALRFFAGYYFSRRWGFSESVATLK